MHPSHVDLATHLSRRRGVVTSRELASLGTDARQVRRLLRAGHLVRVSRGAYVAKEALDRARPEERHAVLVRAVVAAAPGPVAASHHSAACVWGLPWVGSPPDHVHLVRVGEGEYRRTREYTLHQGWPGLTPRWVCGLPVLAVPETLLGVAAGASLEQVVVSGDAALARRLVTVDQLTEVIRRCRGHRGIPRLRAALAHLDPRSESAGESRARLLLRTLGYPLRTQVEIRDSHGCFLGRVDGLVAGCVVIEFDGQLKYAVDGRGDPSSLVREKAREDRLRAAGYQVVRLVWHDLEDPERVRRLVDQALLRARGR